MRVCVYYNFRHTLVPDFVQVRVIVDNIRGEVHSGGRQVLARRALRLFAVRPVTGRSALRDAPRSPVVCPLLPQTAGRLLRRVRPHCGRIATPRDPRQSHVARHAHLFPVRPMPPLIGWQAACHGRRLRLLFRRVQSRPEARDL